MNPPSHSGMYNKFYSDKVRPPHSDWLVHLCSTGQQLCHYLVCTFPCSQHYWWASGL